jgi:hypothetical protein
MQPGEGMLVIAGAMVLGLAGFAFVRGAQKLSAQWANAVDDTFGETARAEALVPEFAAARFGQQRDAPDYGGRCRCIACRTRPLEPCSDYDGD